MITYSIIITLVICNIIIVALWYRHHKKQAEHISLIVLMIHAQLQMLKFLGNAEVSNLWKIRQEIYSWKCKWAGQEEYEAAQQAQLMIENIEELIKIHSNITKQYENNETENG